METSGRDLRDRTELLKRKKVILVVGVIGSGKSSLCRELGKELDALILMEQAQEHGNPFLDDFYLDMNRWAFTLQIHQLATRYRQHDLAQSYALTGLGDVVIDGGFWLDTCFARLIRKNGLMEEREYETYERLFRSMTSKVMYPNIVIRLNTTPQVALDRVHRRAGEHPERASEADKVDLGYLTMLDNEISLLCHELGTVGVEILRCFWNEDRYTTEQRQQAIEGMAQMIREFDPPDPFLSSWKRIV